MTEQRPVEFGKRRPAAAPPPRPAPKRSSHVALLLMGTLAVGGTGYALMPGESCEPASPGMAAPALPPTDGRCSSHGSSGGGGGGYNRSSRFSFFGDDSSTRAASATTSDASSGSVSRGGFGSFARAFGFSARS
jgi:hypothetical protein